MDQSMGNVLYSIEAYLIQSKPLYDLPNNLPLAYRIDEIESSVGMESGCVKSEDDILQDTLGMNNPALPEIVGTGRQTTFAEIVQASRVIGLEKRILAVLLKQRFA